MLVSVYEVDKVDFQPPYWQEQCTLEDNRYNLDTPTEEITSLYNRKRKITSNKKEMFTQRNYSTRAQPVSSHLMGLNNLMKREVSQINKNDPDFLKNSNGSLFDSTVSQNFILKNAHQSDTRLNILEEESNYLQTAEELKESTQEMITLTMDEYSQEKPSIEDTISEDEEQIDENIDMERIAKMNFYSFKANNQKGIVGMWQNIKKAKSPNKKSGICYKKESSMNGKYKSFLNKSVNDWANLMISNALLKNKKINSSRSKFYMDMPLAKHAQL